ncbi:Starch-binding associating with outer membrane [Pedobacter steynii]|uniref:Starch-binding associating with outer membrane n=1 Tax=Pedobacter steynii TaxID=430522 RepID=A0A1G9UV75_9SPHI|nr:RagB/SusD family nutrient uptake outer membrane protein [Pedobacter steynii]NQX40888.1 RagB/SusD family nutrient uptake outer membrane protein [Pedobacter steynii]SDM63730.1 Starch-binding associating with outer membrane [Pedobacter steynii]
MKLNNKIFGLFLANVLVLLLVSSCKKGLDYTNNGVIVPEAVWGNPNMIKAYLNDIYGKAMPGWSFNGADSDEGITEPKQFGDYQRGIISEAGTKSDLDYNIIDRANFFLDELENVPTTVLSAELNQQYTAEAKFWRAWAYWGMVSRVGGIPIILHKQDFSDVPGLFKPRNKTSECVAQIIKDLDDAIAVLPGVYPNAGLDYGRITKVAAMAMKGRVLLSYASPLFNPSNNAARWQTAYDACKAAVDYGAAQGHALHPNYRTIWHQERNKEVVMVNQYFEPGHTIQFSPIRPLPMTSGSTNNNQPLLSLLLAFPKKDGSPMQFDKDMLSNPDYNTQFLDDFYNNRDDRFYTTVWCGGTPYPTPDDYAPGYVKGNSYWIVWQHDAAANKYTMAASKIHSGYVSGSGCTGFFERKGLDTTLTAVLSAKGQTDWIEMRYAELLMNYGECANETGKSSEALEVLKSIRKRAGIAAGAAGNYGIAALSQPDIREAYIKERQVEFAFEGKRLGDLRRWKRYDILNNQGARHGLYITLKNAADVPAPADNIAKSAAVRSKFRAAYIDNLDGDINYKFNLDLNHWFWALSPSQISQSKGVLLQNKEWGGTFDPLN